MRSTMTRSLALLLAALFGFTGCSADTASSGSEGCVAGDACFCEDGQSGLSTCDDDGRAGCACDAPVEADAGAADAGAADATPDDAQGADTGGGGEDAAPTGCTPIPQWPDLDRDGAGDAAAEPVEDCDYLDGYSLVGSDCDDNDPDRYPFAPELCDGRDNDCDDEIDEQTTTVTQWPDVDGDGFGDRDGTPAADCAPLDGYVRNDDDCDDASEAIAPGVNDTCDGVDNDCDDEIDEDATFALFWPDADDDTFGDAASVPQRACAQPAGTVTNREDCDDSDPAIFPGAEEVCDLRDNDCDGALDEGTPLLVLYPDTDGDGAGDLFASAALSCEPIARFVSDQSDCDDENPDVYPGAVETCDGVDEDCDGAVDEEATDLTTWYADVDGDGAGDGANLVRACARPSGYVSNASDCDDRNDTVAAGTEEVCDGADNDCDGAVDEGVSNRCGTCGAEPEEVCGDFIDNDCDGAIDEPEAGCFCDGRTNQPCYPGEPQTLGIGACRGGVVSCTCPSGDRFCDDGVYGECVGAVTPSPEVCDGIDNNCDGRIDEGVRNPCGGCGAVPVEVCDGVDNDCDGRIDEGVRNACGQCPGDEAAEVCNGFDDDCDGFVDEGCTCEGDGESCYPGPPATLGVGACAAGIRDCYASTSGTGLCEGAVLPGLEVCNDVDDDCDGRVDVGPTGCSVCGTSPETCNGIDDDCDGFIDEGLRNACGDCLDAVVPEELGGAELCNGFDDDCDGLVDEGLVNACGTCDEVCYVDGFDDDETFNEGEGEGIEIADGIRLNSSSFTFSDIWVANTADDTVTRINTETGAVINTYEVGYNGGRNNDNPSRTAVDFDGNAWVANRAFGQQGSIAKIRGGDCVDDCVAFIVPVGGSNALPRGLAIDTDGNVWVGLDNSRTIVKLSGTNGAQLGSWNVGIRTYGLAIDNRGILWIATIDGGVIGAFDTNTNTYLGAWSGAQCTRPYGIAVDGDGNVWAGNWTCGNVVRLDRASFDRGERPPRFDYYGTGLSNTRGIAVDANNVVWVASSGNDRIARLNRTTGAQLGTTATCDNPIGVGVANDGDVWAVCYGSDRAERFDAAGIVVGNVTVGDQPYSYSDMTGFQLRNFTSPRGTWRTVFDCTFADCAFDYVRFEASTPAGTAVSLRFRTQPPSGPWSAWTASFAASPIDLRGLAPRGQRLEIEVQLSTDANGVSPVLQSFDVEWQRP